MPFNSSTPVFYWNKEMFQKAGLDPNKPPATWAEVGEYGKKLIASGAKCGFTSQWQTWALIENFGALHNLPYATKQNGFGGADVELKFNDAPRVKLIQTLLDWSKDKVWVYGGREGRSTNLFNSGECGMHIASSGTASAIQQAMGSADKYGIAMMPYDSATKAQPQNSIIGGATLWVLQGKPKPEYVGVAKFFSYLSKPETQAKWHQETGYVPITTAAAKLTEEQGFYKKFPGRDVAVKQLTMNPPTENSKGLRIGNFVQIRDVVDEELENVWSGKKQPKQALDDAATRGNKLVRDFVAANK
jgi:sn-glycerol 3-phosphate transport system substrate-binding protein